MRLLIDFPSFKDDNDDDDDDKDDNDVEVSKCYLFLSMYFFLQYNIFSKEKFLKLRPSKAYFLLWHVWVHVNRKRHNNDVLH